MAASWALGRTRSAFVHTYALQSRRHISGQAALWPESKPLSVEDFSSILDGLPPSTYERRGRVGVALSGGPDSTALAYMLHNHLKARGGQAVAFIVDHGLRPESAAEAESTAAVARSWGMEAHISTLEWPEGKPSSGNLQEKARIARADMLASLAKEHKINEVFVGHQADDAIETFLFRFGRASGTVGLAGLAPVSALGNSSQVAATRPLLSIPRSALTATCVAHSLPFVEDPSNEDETYDRVRIRSAALSLPRQEGTQQAQASAAPTKDELARLTGFLSFVRAEQRADVDDVIASSVTVNKRWGAVELDVQAFLQCESTDIQDQVIARLLEFTASRSKPVKAPTARGMREWLHKTHAEYTQYAHKLHSIQMGKKRVSPAERTAARDALTKLLERKCAAGGCLAQPVQPTKPRAAKAFRSTPDMTAPLRVIVAQERVLPSDFARHVQDADKALPISPNGPWVSGIDGRWNMCVVYNPQEHTPTKDESSGRFTGAAPWQKPQRPKPSEQVQISPAFANLTVRHLTQYGWNELMMIHPWMKRQLHSESHILKWGRPVVCREVNLKDPRVIWLTMKNHMQHSEQRVTFARRQQTMMAAEARLGAENYTALVAAMPSRLYMNTVATAAALSVVAVPGTVTSVVPGLRAFSAFSPGQLLYNSQRDMLTGPGFMPKAGVRAGKAGVAWTPDAEDAEQR